MICRDPIIRGVFWRLTNRPISHVALLASALVVAAWGLASPMVVGAQTAGGLLQVDDATHRFLARQQASGILDDAHLSLLPITARTASQLLDTVSVRADRLSHLDRRILAQLRGTTPSTTTTKVHDRVSALYANGRDFFSADGPDFNVQVNPLAYLSVGKATYSATGEVRNSATTWQNTRGLRASGTIGGSVYFETRLEENQRRDPIPIFDDFNRTAPRLGDSDFNPETGVLDYLVATGIIGYERGVFDVRFGRDRNRWGNGIGSMHLSNYGPVYDQLQVRATFWMMQYSALFASLPTGRLTRSDGVIPKKYASIHRVEFNLPYRLQVGLYESVIFATDSLGSRQGFDLAYLNPVIFLRAVEADRGSPDNVLIGASLAWTAVDGVRLYSELLLDELRVSEIGNKWWANKWGFQLGAHLVPHPMIDVVLEYTRLRPYLYAHRDPTTAYVAFGDLLGHPAGPNAKDYVLIANVQPTPRIHGRVEAFYTLRGRSPDGLNFGEDPQASNVTRNSDTGVAILQGIRQTETSVTVMAGYELLPSLFFEAGVGYFAIDDGETGVNRYVNPSVSMRWGLPVRSLRY